MSLTDIPGVRVVSIEYSEDNFAGTGANKSLFSQVYTGSALTGYMIDGSPMPVGPDPVATLKSLRDTIGEYREDDENGTADPDEKVLQSKNGGPLCTRSPDTLTLAIAPRAAVPIARAYKLEALLVGLGYGPPVVP